jgi:hypothetical protein
MAKYTGVKLFSELGTENTCMQQSKTQLSKPEATGQIYFHF